MSPGEVLSSNEDGRRTEEGIALNEGRNGFDDADSGVPSPVGYVGSAISRYGEGHAELKAATTQTWMDDLDDENKMTTGDGTPKSGTKPSQDDPMVKISEIGQDSWGVITSLLENMPQDDKEALIPNLFQHFERGTLIASLCTNSQV